MYHVTRTVCRNRPSVEDFDRDAISLFLVKTSHRDFSHALLPGLFQHDIKRVPLSRPQVDACVLACLRNRGNWNTQAHTGRIVVDYAAHSKNIRVSEHLGALGRQRIHVHVTGDETQ